MKFTRFLIITLVCYSSGLFAQTVDQRSDNPDSLVFETEKLYIHTDKETYLSGETIWFKGYLSNSSYLTKVPVSNYIYVEFYSDTLISRVKIKNSDKGFAGHIQTSGEIAPGTYRLRCYTQNMQNYPVEYLFHKKIEILGKNNKSAGDGSKRAEVSAYDIDIQFLPESGRYLVNRPAGIGFKAVGSDGKSVNVRVMLYNSKDTLVGQYSSKHNGMGLVNLFNADSGGYYAIVSDSSGFTKRVLLPQPEISGAIIGITRIGKKINISAYVTRDIKGSLLVIMNGSEELFKKPLAGSSSLEDSESNVIMPEGDLPDGVNSAQIRNENGDILAERLFFINNHSRPNIEILQDKKQYGQREKVELTFQLKDKSGDPLSGELSLAVTDSELAPLLLNNENIVSYMELSSELRGEIEDPGYYFNNPSAESERYLDIVMMTHGWRYHTSGLRKFKREYSQEISGSVSGLFRKEVKNTTLMIFAPTIQLQQAYLLEKKSTFTLEGLNFPDSTKFLFGVVGKGGGQLYGLNIRKEVFLPLSFPRISVYNKQIEEFVKSTADLYNTNSIADENIILKEVVVVAQEKEFYKPKYNPSPFLQSFSRGQLKERGELELYDQMFLQDYLIVAFPGLYVGSDPQGYRVLYTARGITMNGPGEPLLYVDGLQWQSTALLDQYGLTVMDIENVAFLRGPAGSMFNTINGVILVTSRKNGGIQKGAATNTAKISPLGYQRSVDFYSPKYENTAEKKSQLKDLRSTIYWNPCIRTDEKGLAKVTFYTGDRSPKLNISAQGVTSSGDFVVVTQGR